jgi:signal transduction histidine kinase
MDGLAILNPGYDFGGECMKPLRYALSLASAYGIIAALYIWLSSTIAARIALDVHDLEKIERLKGFGFVFVTSVIFFIASWIILYRFKRITLEQESLRRAAIMAQGRVLAGELAAAVAHDFNNALTVVQCAISEAQETPITPTNNAILREASEAVHRAKEIALRLAHTARGQHVLHAERLDLSAYTQRLIRSLSKLPRLLGCTIKLISAPNVMAKLDPTLFEQIITNLILNAAEATGPKGVIHILLAEEPSTIRLEVHDNGPGIPLENRENIFKAFETTKSDGLGLGLLSVRAAVMIQNGILTVDESPLGGAAFIVRIPQLERANVS